MGRKPIDLPALLDSLTTDLTTTQTHGGFDSTAAGRRVRTALADAGHRADLRRDGIHMSLTPRIELLSRYGPDPRIARRIMQLITSAPFFCATDELAAAGYGPLFQVVSEMQDVRQIPKLEALLVEAPAVVGRELYDRMIAITLRELRAVEVNAPEPETLALAMQLGFKPEPTPRPPVDTRDLFARVVSRLDDDDLRAVLADRWLEAGHSQGELISIHLRQARGEAAREGDRERINTLLYYGEREWLGDLAVVTRNRVYERGFLDACELSPEAAAVEATWLEASRDIRLGTIRVLRDDNCSPYYWSFALSPAMKNLEEVEIRHLHHLTSLLDHPLPGKVRRLFLSRERLGEANLEAVLARAVAHGGIEAVTIETARSASDLAELLVSATSTMKVSIVCAGSRCVARRVNGELCIDVETRDGLLLAVVEATCPTARVVRLSPASSFRWGLRS